MPHKNFDGFIQGKGALYQNFWTARQAELHGLSEPEVNALTGYFSEEVFGITMDDDDEEEYERQKIFNEAKKRELAERREKSRGGSRDQDDHGAESGEKGKDGDDG